MKREHLEQFLERGYQLGFEKSTDSPDHLGWILVCKRNPDDRYLSLLKPGEEPEFVANQELYRTRPYQVQVIELPKEVLESDRYESNEDYRVNQVHYFPTLDAVEEFVQKFGHTLTDIRWRSEINAP